MSLVPIAGSASMRSNPLHFGRQVFIDFRVHKNAAGRDFVTEYSSDRCNTGPTLPGMPVWSCGIWSLIDHYPQRDIAEVLCCNGFLFRSISLWPINTGTFTEERSGTKVIAVAFTYLRPTNYGHSCRARFYRNTACGPVRTNF